MIRLADFPNSNKMQHDKVTNYFAQSQKDGHTYLAGGKIEKKVCSRQG